MAQGWKAPTWILSSVLFFWKARIQTRMWLQAPYTVPTMLLALWRPPPMLFNLVTETRCTVWAWLSRPALWPHKGNSSYKSERHLTAGDLIHNANPVFFFLGGGDISASLVLTMRIQYFFILMYWCREGGNHASIGIWSIKTCWREIIICISVGKMFEISIPPHYLTGTVLLITIEEIQLCE